MEQSTTVEPTSAYAARTGSLAAQLDAFMAGLLERADPETAAGVRKATAQLAEAAQAARAVQAGEAAPEFVLADQHGGAFSLGAALRRGPVVLIFFRGGWCPFCTLTLRAMAALGPDLARAGGQLVAISPQTGAHSLDMAERHGLGFPILSDPGSAVASAYGLSYEISAELRPLFARLGHALPDVNGAADWRLPIPAGYVIGRDGVVVHAVVGPQVNRRLEPEEARAVLRRMAEARG